MDERVKEWQFCLSRLSGHTPRQDRAVVALRLARGLGIDAEEILVRKFWTAMHGGPTARGGGWRYTALKRREDYPKLFRVVAVARVGTWVSRTARGTI